MAFLFLIASLAWLSNAQPLVRNANEGDIIIDHAISVEHDHCSLVLRLQNIDPQRTAIIESVFLVSADSELPIPGAPHGIRPHDQFALRSRFKCNFSAAHLLVKFRWQNSKSLDTRVAIIRVPDEHRGDMSGLMAPIVGFLGVALGSLLTHWFTTSRERIRAVQEWCKAYFMSDQAAFKRFVRDWGGQPNAILLSDAFSRLEDDCWVPASIRLAYQRAVKALKADGTQQLDREQACQNLMDIIEGYRREPWGKRYL
jgi:hypothetical protein